MTSRCSPVAIQLGDEGHHNRDRTVEHDVLPVRGWRNRSYHGTSYRGILGLMKVDKLSVSFDPELGDAVRAAANRSGRGLSGWLAEAAAAKLRAEALADFLDAWEAEHGPLTAEELATATAELGLPNAVATGPAA
jgi:hypothetical protein